MTKKTASPKRSYPDIYEKIIPIALGILGLIVIAILVFTILIATGLLGYA
jgi:hypothetical protein